jgi:hypothetical protein
MKKLFSFVLGVGLCSLVACQSAAPSDPGSREAVDDQAEALPAGCHSVCPVCPPNKMCPMIACYLDCNGQSNVCQSDSDCTMAIDTCGGGCSCEPRRMFDFSSTCSENIANCGGSDPCAQAGFTPYCDSTHHCSLLAYAL